MMHVVASSVPMIVMFSAMRAQHQSLSLTDTSSLISRGHTNPCLNEDKHVISKIIFVQWGNIFDIQINNCNQNFYSMLDEIFFLFCITIRKTLNLLFLILKNKQCGLLTNYHHKKRNKNIFAYCREELWLLILSGGHREGPCVQQPWEEWPAAGRLSLCSWGGSWTESSSREAAPRAGRALLAAPRPSLHWWADQVKRAREPGSSCRPHSICRRWNQTRAFYSYSTLYVTV